MRLTLLFALIASLAPPPQRLLAQQGDDAAWSQVRQLTAGDSVRVLQDDAVREGLFRIANDDSITLSRAGQDQSVPRAGIRRVLVARGSHRKRNVLLGLAIGGLTGGLVVAFQCRGQGRGCNEIAPAYFYPFAAAGAGIGALLPAHVWTQAFP